MRQLENETLNLQFLAELHWWKPSPREGLFRNKWLCSSRWCLAPHWVTAPWRFIWKSPSENFLTVVVRSCHLLRLEVLGVNSSTGRRSLRQGSCEARLGQRWHAAVVRMPVRFVSLWFIVDLRVECVLLQDQRGPASSMADNSAWRKAEGKLVFSLLCHLESTLFIVSCYPDSSDLGKLLDELNGLLLRLEFKKCYFVFITVLLWKPEEKNNWSKETYCLLNTVIFLRCPEGLCFVHTDVHLHALWWCSK